MINHESTQLSDLFANNAELDKRNDVAWDVKAGADLEILVVLHESLCILGFS
jgi:hypothetical protein